MERNFRAQHGLAIGAGNLTYHAARLAVKSRFFQGGLRLWARAICHARFHHRHIQLFKWIAVSYRLFRWWDRHNPHVWRGNATFREEIRENCDYGKREAGNSEYVTTWRRSEWHDTRFSRQRFHAFTHKWNCCWNIQRKFHDSRWGRQRCTEQGGKSGRFCGKSRGFQSDIFHLRQQCGQVYSQNRFQVRAARIVPQKFWPYQRFIPRFYFKKLQDLHSQRQHKADSATERYLCGPRR